MKKSPPIPSDFKELLTDVKTMSDFESVMGEFYKQGIQHLLQGEMSHFLGYDKHDPSGYNSGNSRNGTTKKMLKSSTGKIELEVPRDRNGEFEPVIVPKGQSTTAKIEEVIIGLYSRGMSTSDITAQIKEIYGLKVSKSFISDVTAKMIDSIGQWQNRPLEELYCILWMDCIVVKVRENHRIVKKSIYVVIGLDESGHKEILGLWIHDTESASFWLSVLDELKQRGVQKVLIACTDNLTGFTNAIEAAFPECKCQLCVVHQIRNSIKYVPWKDRRAFLKDLKAVYGAINIKQAKQQFEIFKNKWGKKYGYAIKSWEQHWNHLTTFFEFPKELRKIMYTTNTIEGLNRGIRKYTKTKTIFPNEGAAIKAIFLAIQNIESKWTKPIRDWAIVQNQLLINFNLDKQK